MPVGITQLNNITLDNITGIANATTLAEFAIRVNHDIYQGWFWFIILLTMWIILFVVANRARDQPLNNLMYTAAAISILSFIIRGINVTRNGVIQGMLTDHQMWIFPLITAILAFVIWSTKE